MCKLVVSLLALLALGGNLMAQDGNDLNADWLGGDAQNEGELNDKAQKLAHVHLEELQKIATNHNNRRSAGSSGYRFSALYVSNKLKEAGYKPWTEIFEYTHYKQTAPGEFQLVGNDEPYKEKEDFNVMAFSPSGDVKGTIIPVKIELGPNNKSQSGCESSHFDDFKKIAGDKVALLQRGHCSFQQKAQNAQNAGAVGVAVFNQGNDGRTELFGGTLGSDSEVEIPVLSIGYDLGAELALGDEGKDVLIKVESEIEQDVTMNVFAETPWGDPDSVVMVGSHLDSVEEGPGINDNGSGSAAILAVALALKEKNIQYKNKLRFAWWGAEELGLVGSTQYVQSLTDLEKTQISLYLNFDMVASPNYMLGVYDGDGSKFKVPGPKGSGIVEAEVKKQLEQLGKKHRETESDNRSDYAAFAAAGIPFGGLFTGAEKAKSEDDKTRFGGEAGVPYDKNYHQIGDDLANINKEALGISTRVIFSLLKRFGENADDVNKARHESLELAVKANSFASSAAASAQSTYYSCNGMKYWFK